MGQHSRRAPRTWWRIVGTGALVLLTALLAVSAVAVNMYHVKLEPVLSGSMRPHVQPGDLAIVRPVPIADIRTGDVIAYLPPQQARPVLHRIVELERADDGIAIVTRGDANNTDDPWGRVTLDGDSVDRLITAVPKVGFLLNQRTALLRIAGVIILAVAVLWTFSLIRDRRRLHHSLPPREEAYIADDDATDQDTNERNDS